MSYAVKEIYYTLQGEGMQAGRAAVFCRFTGCNLWSGREEDRARAICQFCDTDFLGVDGPQGGRYPNAEELAQMIAQTWQGLSPLGQPLVVFTGGEPLLQLDEALVTAVHAQGFEVAIETNGVCMLSIEVDHICVSPKAHTELLVTSGQELKLVYPQEGAEPDLFTHLNFDRFYLQPMDGPQKAENTQAAIQYCLTHPQWRLSVQTHKVIGIP